MERQARIRGDVAGNTMPPPWLRWGETPEAEPPHASFVEAYPLLVERGDRYVRRWLASPADQEDVLQEALLTLVKRWGVVGRIPVAAKLAYLRTCIYHLAVRVWRDGGRTKPSNGDAGEFERADLAAEDRFDAVDNREELTPLRDIPAGRLRDLVDVDAYGETRKAVAIRTGRSAGSVKRNVWLARRDAARLLSDSSGNDG